MTANEITVAELQAQVHDQWCLSGDTHDAACNTLRLLVDDWKHLDDYRRAVRTLR